MSYISTIFISNDDRNHEQARDIGSCGLDDQIKDLVREY